MTYLVKNFDCQSLQDSMFFLGAYDTNSMRSSSWTSFSDSWGDLKKDEYMADGGSYRFRRYSEFQLDQEARTLSVLPHVPYRQTIDYNPLNGGVDRWYQPIREDVYNGAAFKDILLSCADVISPIRSSTKWTVRVFQNRISTNSKEIGKPTPEGVHRDGADYIMTLLIKRHNVSGGESSLYEEDGKTVKASVTLTDPGDFIFLDDRRAWHGVEPIACLDPAEEGYRDMLIVMFSQ